MENGEMTPGDLLRVEEERAGKALTFVAAHGRLTLEALSPGALRLQVDFNEACPPADAGAFALPDVSSGEPLTWEEKGEHILVQAAPLLVRVGRSPLRLEIRQDEEVLWSQPAGGGIWMDGAEVGLRWELQADEALFGLGAGAPARRPDQRGHTATVYHRPPPHPRSIIPLVLSTRHYAVLVDNAWKGRWDLGASSPKVAEYTAEAGRLEWIILAGRSLADLLRRYHALVGPMPMPPVWSLGVHLLTDLPLYEDGLLEAAEAVRRSELPCEGLFLRRRRVKTDLPSPHLRGLQARLRAQGFHLTLVETPYVHQLEDAGGQVPVGRRPDGAAYALPTSEGRQFLVDFTAPSARAWTQAHQRELVALGFEGVVADENEPALHPPDMIHAGGPAAAVHNRFAAEMVSSLAGAWWKQAPDCRPFLASRAWWPTMGCSGAGQWAGERPFSWEGLAEQVRELLHASMAGVPLWMNGVGAFSGDLELFIRWLQFSAFCPWCMLPATITTDFHSLWEDEETLATARQTLRLRYRFLPYLYSYLWRAVREGVPMVRPLSLEFEEDIEARKIDDAFLLGREMLVAPVLEPAATGRRVYVPAGQWYDGWTEEIHAGNTWLDVSSPLKQIPLFFRAGALVPFASSHLHSGERGRPWSPLTVHYYAGAGGEFSLYEDDGTSWEYGSGAYRVTTMLASEEGGIVQLEVDNGQGEFAGGGKEVQRAYEFWVHGLEDVTGVQLDNRPLTGLASREAWRTVRAGWWRREERNLVGIKVPQTAEGLSIVIRRRERKDQEELAGE